jgi:hypothetical protein
MYFELKFSLEVVEGTRLGKLVVPLAQVARWLNFLTSPHYGAEIIFSEQGQETVTIYFDAYDEVYSYLSDRLSESKPFAPARTLLPLAS